MDFMIGEYQNDIITYNVNIWKVAICTYMSNIFGCPGRRKKK